MKINKYSNDVRTLVFYSENNEKEQSINPYNSKAFFDTTNMLGDSITSYDDYYKIIISDLVECSNNQTHIKAKQKKGLCFVVWVAGKYGDVNGVLYIPFNKVKSHEIIEEKDDQRGDGCICVSYNDKIVFDDSIKIVCCDSEHYFLKGSDPLRNSNDDFTSIGDCIAKEEEHLQKYPTLYENAQRLIELYKEKQAQGFEYRCFSYRSINKDYKYLMLYNCVDHYEKTSEYVKAEKLTEEIKKINKNWGVDDTIKLLKAFKLTRKRTTKKGE